MRVTAPPVTIKDIWDALTVTYGVAGSYGLLLETNLDSKVSLAKADLTTLETRLSAARAGYLDNINQAGLLQLTAARAALLDNLDALISSRLAAASYVTERGTDSAALASAWTAALATILGNFSAARIGYLDNINASLKELAYTNFASLVDDLAGNVVTGDCTDFANLFDNDEGTVIEYTGVNQYVEIAFPTACYIKRFRIMFVVNSNVNNRYKIEAYVDGAWENAHTGIVDLKENVWGDWTDITTPKVSNRFRVTITTFDTLARLNEVYLRGVPA